MIDIRYHATLGEIREARKVLIAPGATQPQSASAGVVGWALFIGLSTMLFFILQHDRPTAPPSPPAPAVRLARAGFWVGAAAVATALAAIPLAARAEKRWRIARVERYVFTDAEVIEVSSDKRVARRWEAFHSFAETPNLFVIRERPDYGRVIPKRLFADPSSLAAFHSLLVQKLAPPPPPPPVASPAPDAERPEGGAVIHVEYRVAADDFVEVFRHRFRLLPTLRRLRKDPARNRADRTTIAILAAMACGALLMTGASAFLVTAGERGWVLGAAAGLAGLWLVCYILRSLVSPKTARKAFDADPRNADPFVLRADDAGITVTGPLTETRLEWAGVLGAVALPAHVGIIDADELIHAIPLSAFESRAAADELVAFVQSRAANTRAT